MNTEKLLTGLKAGVYDDKLKSLYGEDAVGYQRERYAKAVEEFISLYGSDRCAAVFSVPGRSEISGNHTDHNHGCVIAAAVSVDIIAVASENESGTITVKSEGFPADSVSSVPGEPDKSEYFTSSSLISGVCAGFINRSHKTGGFDAYTTSSVLKGSGLSSSAAFEVMIGNIMNYFFNDGSIPNAELAIIAQYAENVYFGKPSGLMDQTACAVGGFTAIDFGDPDKALIEKLDFDLTKAGYCLCITNTGGNHADLNEDYASIPAEMKLVASQFGRKYLRGLTLGELVGRMGELREKCGDRALLRAYHFINENERVKAQTEALRRGDLPSFLAGVRESGLSSFTYLQNVYTVKNVGEQGLSLALALTEYLLSGSGAAWRVHGGGFAGTVQAFVPVELIDKYREGMDGVFGKGACSVLSVRGDGAVRVI